MLFQSSPQAARTIYPVFLAGFHDSRHLDGVVFLNPQQAHAYCEDKVIYVKEVPFYTKEKAEAFVNQMALCWVNHIRSLDGNPVNFISEIECEQFKKEVEKVING